jgi:hypothetical protein
MKVLTPDSKVIWVSTFGMNSFGSYSVIIDANGLAAHSIGVALLHEYLPLKSIASISFWILVGSHLRQLI